MTFQKRLWPCLVPDQTMEHIHDRHEQHISRGEILEVMNRNPDHLNITKAPLYVTSDYNVRGETHDGKYLFLCVILEMKDIEQFYQQWELQNQVEKPVTFFASLVYNGWCIEQ